MNNLNAADALSDELLGKHLALLIHVDNMDIAFIVGQVELLLIIVPAHACEHSPVRVDNLTLHIVLSCRFEPLQFLVIADGEDEVF